MTLTPQSVQEACTIPGLRIMVEEEVSSTNTLLRQMAEAGAAERTVLIAKRQTAGRGRRDHTFFSPGETGLYLSLLLRPKLPARDALLLTTCAAASVAEAIEEVAGAETKIKWVNDVFCRGRKVCGILTEGAVDAETGGLRYAVLGIGVNLYPPKGGFPPEIQNLAGWVFPERDGDARSRLAGAILHRFHSYYPRLEEKPFFPAYEARSLVLGQDIDILENGGRRPAKALALNPDFSLLVRERDGKERVLDSGEVSIRTK